MHAVTSAAVDAREFRRRSWEWLRRPRLQLVATPPVDQRDALMRDLQARKPPVDAAVRLHQAMMELFLARSPMERPDELAHKARVVMEAALAVLVEVPAEAEDVAAVERAYATIRRESTVPEGGKIRDALLHVERSVHRLRSPPTATWTPDAAREAAWLRIRLTHAVDPKFAAADPTFVQDLLDRYSAEKKPPKGTVSLNGIVGRLMAETGALGAKRGDVTGATKRAESAMRVGITTPKKVRTRRKRRRKT